MTARSKYIGLLIIVTVLCTLYYFFDPNSFFFPKCPLYSNTGIYCPGCGSQRAFHDILHMDFIDAISNNILFIIAILITLFYIVTIIINNFFNRNIKSFLYRKKALLIILVIIIIFWILRNIPIHPFSLLAPD